MLPLPPEPLQSRLADAHTLRDYAASPAHRLYTKNASARLGRDVGTQLDFTDGNEFVFCEHPRDTEEDVCE